MARILGKTLEELSKTGGDEVYSKNTGFRQYVMNNQTLRSIDDSIRERIQNQSTDAQIEKGMRNPLRPKKYSEISGLEKDTATKNVAKPQLAEEKNEEKTEKSQAEPKRENSRQSNNFRIDIELTPRK